ncbi:MAG: penicillin-binding protein 2 [Pseudomonadota bacterium]
MVGLSIKDPIGERALFSGRVLFVFACMLVLCGILVARFLHLQVTQYEAFQTRSDENRIQVQPLAPPRGLIFDRHGELLAENRVASSLALVTERTDDLGRTIGALSRFVHIAPHDITDFEQRLKRKRRPHEPVVLRMGLSEEEIALLSVNRHLFRGVEINKQLIRHYPLGSFFSHAVGSVRRITESDLRRLDEVSYSGTRFMGKRGVEKFYEASLHGEVGYQHVETDAHGRVRQVLEINPPVAGHNITLHLDSRLQIAASGALGERRGAVVAMDPKSGGLLALVSQPGYDPNLFVAGMTGSQFQTLSGSIYKPLFNRALNGQYAAGSTFKPVVGLAGIVNQAITWEETIEDNGSFQLPGQERIYRDWNWRRGNSGGQGTVDLNRAIYRSSNVFFYDLGTRLEIEQLVSFARQFGFGRNVALDVADASLGLMPDPIWKRGYKNEVWYPGDSVNLSIGQGDLLVTPLQMATVAATIANRGRVVRPRLLLASDAILKEFDPPAPLPSVEGPTPDDWERIVDAMEDVIHRGNKGFGQNGTAWAYIGRDIPYRMAGKSGTAQVVEIRQGEEYDEDELAEFDRKHAWFIAFAPADDPTIAVSVLVENGGGGSSVAAPIARQVIDSYLLPQLASR